MAHIHLYEDLVNFEDIKGVFHLEPRRLFLFTLSRFQGWASVSFPFDYFCWHDVWRGIDWLIILKVLFHIHNGHQVSLLPQLALFFYFSCMKCSIWIALEANPLKLAQAWPTKFSFSWGCMPVIAMAIYCDSRNHIGHFPITFMNFSFNRLLAHQPFVLTS